MNKQIDITQIGDYIKDGMTIAVGGFLGCGNAHNVIDEILKTDVKKLILVSSDTCFAEEGVGKLISNKRVSKIYASHIGTNKDTQQQINDGLLEVELVPQGTLAERLRSATAGLGGVLTKTGLGTLVQEGKDVINIDGQDFLLEKPIYLDLAILKAYQSDQSGNLIYKGASRNFNVPMAGAAKITIAEVEEIVENADMNPASVHTPFMYINHIIKA